jgi:hypothetical protein
VTTTPRLALPYILTQQAQKEVTHAAGLNRLDVLVQPVAQQDGLNAPPGSPADGRCWIVGTSLAGACCVVGGAARRSAAGQAAGSTTSGAGGLKPSEACGRMLL